MAIPPGAALAVRLITVFVFFGLSAGLSHATCGQDTPCEIGGKDGGTYYVSAPDKSSAAADLRIFVFFHGHNGSGKGVMRNRSLLRSLHREGFVVVAPDGPQFTFGNRTSRGWAARPEGEAPRGGRSDIAFVEQVLQKVVDDHGLRLADTMLSGFSSGGSMAWYFACYSHMPLAGVVSIAGGLRRPLPSAEAGNIKAVPQAACPGGPRKLLHIHGFSDRQVPLEGRGIRDWHQGDVFEGLSILRQTNQCGSRPDKVDVSGPFWCRDWTKCGSQKPIRFCLHQGGHGMPKAWMTEALRFIRN